MNATTYAVDTAKNVLQLHWVDADSGEICRRQLSRVRFVEFFARLKPARVAMEACGGSHHWARVLGAMGHRVELLPARQVRGFVRGNKEGRGVYTSTTLSYAGDWEKNAPHGTAKLVVKVPSSGGGGAQQQQQQQHVEGDGQQLSDDEFLVSYEGSWKNGLPSGT
ncbi:MAG: hypothetical protein ACOVPA_04035, partial [Rubrivivax sp.]